MGSQYKLEWYHRWPDCLSGKSLLYLRERRWRRQYKLYREGGATTSQFISLLRNHRSVKAGHFIVSQNQQKACGDWCDTHTPPFITINLTHTEKWNLEQTPYVNHTQKQVWLLLVSIDSFDGSGSGCRKTWKKEIASPPQNQTEFNLSFLSSGPPVSQCVKGGVDVAIPPHAVTQSVVRNQFPRS